MADESPSWRHHYVPQFYLRGWVEAASGNVWQYKREPSGKLSERPVSTKATGFQPDLYTTQPIASYLPERAPDSIERKFFGAIDNGAARALPKLLQDVNSLDDEERFFWAWFLNSLLERHPAVLALRDAAALPVAKEIMDRMLRRSPTAESRARLQDVFADLDVVASARNTVRQHMMREISDLNVIRHFIAQKWTVLRFGSVVRLVTSDSPLVVNGGTTKPPIEMLSISLGPGCLFVMHPSDWKLEGEFLAALIAGHNLTLIEGESRFIYSMGPIEDGPIVKTRKALEESYFPRSGRRQEPISRSTLQHAHCWFDVDRVPRDFATTSWKRTARLRQARWREARGHPIGTEPYSGGERATLVGSRIPLHFAKDTGANFLSPNVLAAVRARLAAPERFQTLKEDRLWADLLSSMPLCFNLFGELGHDEARACEAVRAWWPDAPQGRVTVRFEHSPGRRDPLFLANKSAFDVAFEIAQADGSLGIIGVETKYHEHGKVEAIPKPKALARYIEVTDRSGIFKPDWRTAIVGTDLQQIWLDHLLVLSMSQHPSKRWSWGRFVLVYPTENPSFASAAARYREVLTDAGTSEARTIESLLDVVSALPAAVVSAFRERYL